MGILTTVGNFSFVLVGMVIPPILHNLLMRRVIPPVVIVMNWILAGISSVVMVVCTAVSFTTMIGNLTKFCVCLSPSNPLTKTADFKVRRFPLCHILRFIPFRPFLIVWTCHR